jgi:hypothetical protein
LTNLPLEDRDNPTSWRELLDKALPALDYAFTADSSYRQDNKSPDWTLGGGTAIALRIAHRLSDDVDLFVPSRPLRFFAPANNPAAKAISSRFQWPGHYLKYECAGGEIDFLSAHLQTDPGYTLERFRGREIALETLAEVIVKKIRYRSGSFTSRDIFDLAAVGRVDATIVKILSQETRDALPRLQTVIAARRAAHPVLGDEIRPTSKFEDLRITAYREASAIILAALGGRDTIQPKRSIAD